MPHNRFIPLFSTQAGAVPTASALYQGELAINVVDGKLFTRSGSRVIQLNSRDGLATLQSNTFNGNQLINGNLRVNGTLTATQIYNVYSASIIYASGSSKFGDTADDVMSVTGSIGVRGSISASSVTGSFSGDGSQITGIVSKLEIHGTSINTGSVDLKTQSLNFSGSNGVNTVIQGQTVTIGIPAGIPSSSTQITQLLPSGIVSSSVQINTGSFSGSFKGNEFRLSAGNVSLVFTGSINTGIFGATEYVYPFIPTSSYVGATVEYAASRPGGIRVGMLMASWQDTASTVTDISSTDVGDTSDINFSLVQNDGYMKLRVESAGSGSYPWTVQSIFKLFPSL
jgi:hypothetical protein